MVMVQLKKTLQSELENEKSLLQNLQEKEMKTKIDCSP